MSCALETPVLLRTLVLLAQQTESLDDVKAILTKATEVMDWVWPFGVPQDLTLLEYDGVKLRVPRI